MQWVVAVAALATAILYVAGVAWIIIKMNPHFDDSPPDEFVPVCVEYGPMDNCVVYQMVPNMEYLRWVEENGD
jgi:hypothetical protein